MAGLTPRMCRRKYYEGMGGFAILTYILAGRFSAETIHDSSRRVQYAQNPHKSGNQGVDKKNAIF